MDAAALKKNGLILVIVGIVICSIAPLTGGLVESAAIRKAGSFAPVFGQLIVVYGCMQIAKGKGQSWHYGLLGFLSCIGLAILWFVIPDKNRAG